jgi:hypothetical protein
MQTRLCSQDYAAKIVQLRLGEQGKKWLRIQAENWFHQHIDHSKKPALASDGRYGGAKFMRTPRIAYLPRQSRVDLPEDGLRGTAKICHSAVTSQK